MTNTEIRTRFAPSPTGYMHIGNLRTALYAYLFARANDGTFILRIEDTDRNRYVADAVDFIRRTLDAAGIVPDEGPDDIGGDYGDTIHAAGAGIVSYAGWISGYGYAVIIDHGGGISTLYGHNQALLVSEGQSVSQGQAIAECGSTGNSTGPHCHFEVRVDGEPVDPMGYL